MQNTEIQKLKFHSMVIHAKLTSWEVTKTASREVNIVIHLYYGYKSLYIIKKMQVWN